MLLAHSWPGNVRELRNVLERAVILCGGGLLTREHVALHSSPSIHSMPADLNEVERRRIKEALAETDWNISKSGKRLGLTRTQMYVRLRKYQLDRPAA
jgi:transcriptional regulator of acetoin/glycerol metabolism